MCHGKANQLRRLTKPSTFKSPHISLPPNTRVTAVDEMTTAPELLSTSATSRQPSYAHLFHDMPWLSIPKHRETVFIAPPQVMGGLLGGAGAAPKSSKLQALAAARRKKTEEKKPDDQVEAATQKIRALDIATPAASFDDSTVAAMQQRKRKQDDTSTSSDQSLPGSKRQPINADRPRPATNTTHQGISSPSDEARPREDSMEQGLPEAPASEPSAFASVLFGADPMTHNRPRISHFPLPYLSFAPDSVADAFSGPSPDDVVFAAQAKGSIVGKAKKAN